MTVWSSSILRLERSRVPSYTISNISSNLPCYITNNTDPFFGQLSRFLILPGEWTLATLSYIEIVSTQRTLPFLSNSSTLLSYGENPTTSLTTERTNLFRSDRWPFRLAGRADLGIEVTLRPLVRPTRNPRTYISFFVILVSPSPHRFELLGPFWNVKIKFMLG